MQGNQSDRRKHMNSPQQKPQHDDLDELMSDISKTLARNLAPRSPPPSTEPAAANPPPASSAGHPRPLKWDPPAQRALSPREVLAQVADNAYHLQREIAELVAEVTGENVPQEQVRPVQRTNALLPVINHLAHEIDTAHAGVAHLIAYLRRRVS